MADEGVIITVRVPSFMYSLMKKRVGYSWSNLSEYVRWLIRQDLFAAGLLGGTREGEEFIRIKEVSAPPSSPSPPPQPKVSDKESKVIENVRQLAEKYDMTQLEEWLKNEKNPVVKSELSRIIAERKRNSQTDQSEAPQSSVINVTENPADNLRKMIYDRCGELTNEEIEDWFNRERNPITRKYLAEFLTERKKRLGEKVTPILVRVEGYPEIGD